MSLANYAQYTRDEAHSKYSLLMSECVEHRTRRLGPQYGMQVVQFTEFLSKKTDWAHAPASTKYHLAVDGGLLIHSVGVTETAISLRHILMPSIPLDSVIFCAMYHDIGKIYSSVGPQGSLISRYRPNIQKSTGRLSPTQPFAYNKGGNEIPLTVKDMLLPTKFVDLSDAEMQALMLADGQYVPVNANLAHHETPLALIVHWSDYWNGHVIEGQITADWLSGILEMPKDRSK